MNANDPPALGAIRERHLPLTRRRDDGSEQECCYECDTYFKACDVQKVLAAYDRQAERTVALEARLAYVRTHEADLAAGALPLSLWRAGLGRGAGAPPAGAAEPPAGLYGKFYVSRVDGRDRPGGDREDAEYFVLDTAHDPHARNALYAYRVSCFKAYPDLAGGIYDRLHASKGGCQAHPMTDEEQSALPYWDKDARRRVMWDAEQERQNAEIERRLGKYNDAFEPPGR